MKINISKNKNLIPLIILFSIIGMHLYILKHLVFFPYPELFIYPYLYEKGLLPYKSILDQHFPGVMFFPINLSSLGIDSPMEMRFLHMTLIVCTQIMLFLFVRKLLKSNYKAVFTNLLYLFWQPFFEGYVLWIDSFVPLLLLISLYLLTKINKTQTYYYASGIFLGISLIFKQVVLPLVLAILAYYYLTKVKVKAAEILLGFLAPIFVMLIYLIYIGVISDFFYWTIIYNLTVFSEFGRKLPSVSDLIKSLPVFGTSIILLVYLIFNKRINKVIIIGIYFIGSLFFAYARYDLVHLQPALPFALILIVYFFSTRKHLNLKMVGIFILLSAGIFYNFFRFNKGNKVYFFTEFENKVVESVIKYKKPNESIFAFGTFHHIYQVTNTLPPGKIFVFQFPWFMKVAEDKIYKGILSNPPSVVIRDPFAQVDGKYLVEKMPNIDNYVNKYYKEVENIEGTSILIRK